MKRIPPDNNEVSQYVTYFWDRLKPSQNPRPKGEAINLAKQPMYNARRELVGIKTSADFMEWANRWIDTQDWRKARDTVRAWRYMSRNKLVRASMSGNMKAVLDERAQYFNVPLWRYLDGLGLTPEKLVDLERKAGLGPDDGA